MYARCNLHLLNKYLCGTKGHSTLCHRLAASRNLKFNNYQCIPPVLSFSLSRVGHFLHSRWCSLYTAGGLQTHAHSWHHPDGAMRWPLLRGPTSTCWNHNLALEMANIRLQPHPVVVWAIWLASHLYENHTKAFLCKQMLASYLGLRKRRQNYNSLPRMRSRYTTFLTYSPKFILTVPPNLEALY